MRKVSATGDDSLLEARVASYTESYLQCRKLTKLLFFYVCYAKFLRVIRVQSLKR